MKKTFKCVECGGRLLFNPDNQDLKCEYCGGQSEIINSKTNKPIVRPYTDSLKYEGYKDARHIFQCNSCTTHIATFDDKALTRCPSCGNKDLIEIQESGVHPMEIIPFKIPRDTAGDAFSTWIKSRKFAPNNLKKLAKLKKISGLYAPIFLFNFKATTEFSASCADEYTDSKGNKKLGMAHHVHDVEVRDFNNYIWSANKELSSRIFKGMGGYHTSDVMPYISEYMLGFLGIGSDYSVHDCYNSVKSSVEKEEYSRIKSNLNFRYDDVSFFRATTTLSDVTNSYLYVPVWANHYKYKNKDYHCYINGQTGKVYGKSPKSFWKIFGLISAIVGAGVLFGLFFIL